MRPIAIFLAVFPVYAQDQAGVEFFEKQVRPLFAAQCHACHSSRAPAVFGNLRLDSPTAAAEAARSGKLVKAVKGELPQRMPPGGKLKPEQIAAIEKWVEMGAPWPAETAEATSIATFDLDRRRKDHWAWQPVRKPAQAPTIAGKGKPASRQTLTRRLFYDLTGLPPTPEDLASSETQAQLVDRLLASPRFGEHWARRFMDLVRYAESHGSEGDPDTPEAWRYRDYLIRAFNADVPYDQLIREYIAGDLLAEPRINRELGINESLLGAANLRMVEHGFQPVDPWEDRVKWTDNQIDVFTKAFQGLTVSCARCHDHKFDAISQKDYYALFGIFAGARPTQRAIDLPEDLNRNRAEMIAAKQQVKKRLAESWLAETAQLAKRFDDAGFVEKNKDLLGKLGYPRLEEQSGEAGRREFNRANFELKWDLTNPAHLSQWIGHGTGLSLTPSKPGEFFVLPSGKQAINGIYPSGVYSNMLTPKHNAVLTSPRFKIETDSISLRLLGGNFSFAQLIIENYAVPRAGIYHLRHSAKTDQMGWMRWDTTFWKGFTAYIEFATLDDVTHFIHDDEDIKQKPRPEPVRDGRSWFGAQAVVFHNNTLIPKDEIEPVDYLIAGPRAATYGEHFASRTREAVEAFLAGTMTDHQAIFLDTLVRGGLLANSPNQYAVANYRQLEAEVPVARRAPSILEECPQPQRLLVRGNHKSLGEPVPQRYLSALGEVKSSSACTSRLAVADAVTSPDNPLTARVAVNRVWGYLFGRGLVESVDNFGKLGKAPGNAELLDWLAARFVEDGWSVKKLIRLLANSPLYKEERAPRRLPAESIRDAMLAVSGSLDARMYGPSVPVFYAHETGQTKGDRPKGPLDGDGRRSIYTEIRRNATNPFLEVFDFPAPSTTRGERDVTTVPAQSLALMNSPFVIAQAEYWARRNLSYDTMFEHALGRKPSPAEKDMLLSYVDGSANPRRDAALALFNLKEFIYIQ